MKMIISVISSEDAGELEEALCKHGFSSLRLAATGGLLRGGNTTLISVCEDDDVQDVISLVRDHAGSLESAGPRLEQPYTPVAASGGAVFVLNVEEVLKV